MAKKKSKKKPSKKRKPVKSLDATTQRVLSFLKYHNACPDGYEFVREHGWPRAWTHSQAGQHHRWWLLRVLETNGLMPAQDRRALKIAERAATYALGSEMDPVFDTIPRQHPRPRTRLDAWSLVRKHRDKLIAAVLVALFPEGPRIP